MTAAPRTTTPPKVASATEVDHRDASASWQVSARSSLKSGFATVPQLISSSVTGHTANVTEPAMSTIMPADPRNRCHRFLIFPKIQKGSDPVLSIGAPTATTPINETARPATQADDGPMSRWCLSRTFIRHLWPRIGQNYRQSLAPLGDLKWLRRKVLRQPTESIENDRLQML
jgi:hypothetical protein